MLKTEKWGGGPGGGGGRGEGGRGPAALTFPWPFPSQTAIKRNNPRKFLRSVGDGETVEFDVVEGEKVRAAAGGGAR